MVIQQKTECYFFLSIKATILAFIKSFFYVVCILHFGLSAWINVTRIAMKTKITLVLAIAMLPFFICSQVNTDNTQTVEWYVQNVLVGAGVAITNVQYNGGSAAVAMPQVGQFDNLPSGADVGLAEGMILGSGDITLASQPNTSGGSALGGTGNSGSDADLQSITLNQIYDECIVEFDFVPDGDSINFNYVFASEEYDEYVCGSVNDAFGFFLSGPNPLGGSYVAQNIALIPDPTVWPTIAYTTTPVSINTVNLGVAGFSGTAATCAAIDPAWTTYNIFYTQNLGTNYEYDGRTIVMPVRVPVICGQTYHIKLAIGDGGDSAFDSGVFLEKGSFTSNAVSVAAEIANGDTILWEGCNEAYFAFSRPDTTVDFTVYFNVTGTATMGDDYSAIPDSLVMTAGTLSDTIFLYPNIDTIIEPAETVTIEIYYLNCLGGYDTISASLIINDFIPLTATMDIPPVDPCAAPDSLLVQLEFTGQGADTIHWDMGNGDVFINDTIINYYYTTQGVYYITMYAEDVCGNFATIVDSVVYIANYTQSNAIPPPDMLLCDPPFVVDFNAGAPAPPMAFWDFGDVSGTSTDINPSYTYSDTGTYIVTYIAIDSSTCNIADTATLTVNIAQAETFASELAFTPPPPCGVDTLFVDMAFTGTGADSLVWTMGDGTTFSTDTVNHFYTIPGTYTITMEAYDLLCDKSEQTTQEVSFLGPQLFEVIVPNVITPNGDQVNDEVKFEDADPDGIFHVTVWNRWGLIVYESENPSENWKGLKSNGNALDEGLYYYELIYQDQCSEENEQLKTGYIHLLR